MRKIVLVLGLEESVCFVLCCQRRPYHQRNNDMTCTWLCFEWGRAVQVTSLTSPPEQSESVARYSSGWLEMTQDEAIGVKWLAQGHTASECLRWDLNSGPIHCTTELPQISLFLLKWSSSSQLWYHPQLLILVHLFISNVFKFCFFSYLSHVNTPFSTIVCHVILWLLQ